MSSHHAQHSPVTLDGADLHAHVAGGAHAGAYGANALKSPTDAQAQAGNYKMGRTSVQGLRIAIEQPQGSIRTGKDAGGKEWSSRMAAHYGYFEGTRGADGDGIDCFVGPFPESETVFVINQRNKGGGFDEHKVMVGFMSERHARGAYLDSYERGWAGLQSMVPLSLPQFRWWLKHGNKLVALTAESLPLEASKPMTKKIYWTDTQPDGVSYDQVLYELRRMDGPDGLLLDSVTMAEIMEDADGVIALDALVVENAQLSRLAERLRAIMDRSGGQVKAPAVQVSEPFRARGVTNIATVFELSDGQTVSVFFHNPDTAPNKLAPGDEMISWKWLLNKKDITIVVAPEKGQDLNPRTVAQRIMKLAEKNSPAFQKANTKRAERMGNIEAIRGRIAEKEATLNELVAQVEAARLEKDQRVIAAEDEARTKDFTEALAYLSEKLGAPSGDDIKLYQASGNFGFVQVRFFEKLGSFALNYSRSQSGAYGVGSESTTAKTTAEVKAFVERLMPVKDSGDAPNPIATESKGALALKAIMSELEGHVKTATDLRPHTLKAVKAANKLRGSGDVTNEEFDVFAQYVNSLSPDPVEEGGDPIALVDAAYQFANATDAFKVRVAESIDKEDYSPFASAKAMDMKAKELGAEIHWGMGAALDGVRAEEGDDDDFDPEAEFDACQVVDSDDGETLDGDFKGHPFRGNQHKKASAHSHSAVRASMSAKYAEKDGDTKGAKSAHKSAHYSHMAAAEGTSGKARKYHRKMAKFHGSRAGMTLDSVTFDDASDFARGNIVGKIMQGGELKGRAVIAGDGKAMVFVGDSDDQRVVSTASGNTAAWGEDERMVEWLLSPVSSAFKPSDKWIRRSASEFWIDIPKSTGYQGAEGVTLKKKGAKWYDIGSGAVYQSLTEAQKQIEEWFAKEERTRAEEAASRAEVEAMAAAKAQEPAPPVEVYAFKDASDEALGLLRIGAQNPATRSTYKTAVSVEQSAEAHGMAIRWEAVSTLPTFDDATGGLFGDGDQGHIRGELTYNGTKLAQVYVREDGMSAFEFELVMSEHIDADEEGWAGWHDAWTDVISKMRDVCDDNGIAQPEESPFGRLYEYEVTEDKEGGWWAKFKNEAMSEMRAWSPDKDEVIAKAEAAIALHKSSPYVGRRWNSLYGGVVESVKLAGYPNSGEGSELYEVKYPDGSYRRFQGREMDRRIAKDEFDATPEGIKAAQDASAKYQREAEARRAAEEAAKAENDRLDAKIKEFTDSAGYSARDAGKAREVLKTSLNYGNFGGVMRRMEFLEKAVNAGFKTSTEQVKKIKDKTRLQFNRMDQREQDKHEAKQKAAGTKTEYQVGNYTVTKTEFDYANYLTGKTAATDPAPTPEPTVTPDQNDVMIQYIKISADSLAQLRKVDVMRVISSVAGDNIDGVTRESLGAWISDGRPDLAVEVSEVLAELKSDASTNPAPAANAEDRAFFMSLIDGTYPDLDDPELVNNLEAAYQRNSEDAEMVSLFTQAINAYTTASLAETEGM